MKNKLEETGFFTDPQPHKLLVLGDIFDRGEEAKEMQAFILDLIEKDAVILIRGNHEDLFVKMITDDEGFPFPYHRHNGTFSTALQLTGFDVDQAREHRSDFVEACKQTPYYTRIIPVTRDYFEIKKYVFVHGWIPESNRKGWNWRKATPAQWSRARWTNGIDASRYYRGRKTVVCGHYHTSYGHSYYEDKGSEDGPDADFSPYIARGIIAIDACTAYSGEMNVLIIDDEEETE